MTAQLGMVIEVQWITLQGCVGFLRSYVKQNLNFFEAVMDHTTMYYYLTESINHPAPQQVTL